MQPVPPPLARAAAPALRVPGPVRAWALLLPVAGAAALGATLAAALGGAAFPLMGLLVAYLVPPLSKETVLPVAVAAGYAPELAALAFTATDVLVAAFVAWNWDLLYRVPRFGPRLAAFEADLEARTARWRTVQGLRLGAVFLWMAVPFVGSGAATATLLGRALGARPVPVFGAVVLGALVLNTTYAFLADRVLAAAGVLGLLGGLAMVLLLVLVVRAVARGKPAA